MGKYANTIHCVKRVLPTLDAMLEHLDVREYRINTDTPENTKATAKDLREACAYLRKMDHSEYNDKYLKYKVIADIYLFRERFDYIKVEKKANRQITLDIRSDAPLNSTPRIHPVPSITDLFSMVGYIAARKDIERLNFPNVKLNQVELNQFSKWCDSNQYKWVSNPITGLHVEKIEIGKIEVTING